MSGPAWPWVAISHAPFHPHSWLSLGCILRDPRMLGPSLVEASPAVGFTGGWGDRQSGGHSSLGSSPGGRWALCGLLLIRASPQPGTGRTALLIPGGGRQICPGIFSLRLLTCACSQIYQFLAVVIFNGHIASYLTDLPFLASASPFTSGCWCVPVHPCVCSPGSSGESRGRATGSAPRLCALMAELHLEAPSC